MIARNKEKLDKAKIHLLDHYKESHEAHAPATGVSIPRDGFEGSGDVGGDDNSGDKEPDSDTSVEGEVDGEAVRPLTVFRSDMVESGIRNRQIITIPCDLSAAYSTNYVLETLYSLGVLDKVNKNNTTLY